jgi:hypothetical protein
MENRQRLLNPTLMALAAALGGLLFLVAHRFESPTRDLVLAMATSFVFFVVFDLLLAIDVIVREGRLRAFFGTELTRDQLLLTCADFELHDDARAVLEQSQLRIHYQRPHLEGAPLHTEPILFDRSMCLSDIQGLMSVAAMLGGRQKKVPMLVQDGEVWATHGDCSFVASGLTDNHCTELYRLADQPSLFAIGSNDGLPTVRLLDGLHVENDRTTEYAIIVRYHPDRHGRPNRRWFLIAGLEEFGSAAAGDFLAREWRTLSKLARKGDDFVAVVALPRGRVASAQLRHVVARDASRAWRVALPQ